MRNTHTHTNEQRQNEKDSAKNRFHYKHRASTIKSKADI